MPGKLAVKGLRGAKANGREACIEAVDRGTAACGEFEAFIEDFIAVLDDFKVGQADQDELVSWLRSFRGEIVEVDSSQEGTPLPPAFVPAPAL